MLSSGYLLFQNLAMHQTELADAQAMARLAHGPTPDGDLCRHGRAGDVRSRRILVLHRDPRRNRTFARDVAARRDADHAGTAMSHGNIALLYLPKSHRMNQLSLMKDGQVVGQAELVF